jgi:uncharacterized DUF497 family protein
MDCEWDPEKAALNLAKHGVDIRARGDEKRKKSV